MLYIHTRVGSRYARDVIYLCYEHLYFILQNLWFYIYGCLSLDQKNTVVYAYDISVLLLSINMMSYNMIQSYVCHVIFYCLRYQLESDPPGYIIDAQIY